MLLTVYPPCGHIQNIYLPIDGYKVTSYILTSLPNKIILYHANHRANRFIRSDVGIDDTGLVIEATAIFLNTLTV